MTDILKKDVDVLVVVAGVTAVPAIAPAPAYCVDIPHTTQTWTYRIVRDDDGRVFFFPIAGPLVTTITHACFPSVEGSPGSPGSAPVIETHYNAGWSGAAVSIADLTGDGIYKFSVDGNAVGVVTGFNGANEGAGYIEIEHGIYAASGTFQIIESGVPKTAPLAFASSDVFAIRRLGTQVAYYKGATKIYTSTAPSSGTVFVDASLYFGGDQIVDPSLSTTVEAGFAGSGLGTQDPALPAGNTPPATPSGGIPSASSILGVLHGLRGFATDSTVAAGGGVGSGDTGGSGPGAGGGDSGTTGIGGGSGGPNGTSDGDYEGRAGGELRGLVGVAASYNTGSVDTGGGTGSGGSGALPDGDYVGRSGNQLRGLVGEAFGSSDAVGTPNPGTHYAICAGVLNDPAGTSTGLVGSAEGGLLQPQFAVVDGVLPSLSGFAIALAGMSGVCEGKLPPLHGFAANFNDAEVGSGNNGGSGSSGPVDVNLFVDTFTGAGDLSTHSPELSGGQYSSAGDTAAYDLNGTGGLPSTGQTAEAIAALVYPPTSESYSLQETFALTAAGADDLTLELSGIDSATGAQIVDATLSWNGSTWTVELTVLGPDGLPVYTASTTTTLSVASHTLTVDVTPGGVVVKIDSSTLLTSTVPPGLPIDSVGFLDYHEGGTSNITLDKVLVYETTPSTIGAIGGGSGGPNATGDGDYAGRIGGELRGLVGFSYDASSGAHGYADLTLPALRRGIAFGHTLQIFDGDGEEVPGYGLFGELPPLTLEARGGARGAATLPMVSLEASGTLTALGHGRATLPALTLEASGTLHILGRARLTLPALTAGASASGGRAALRLPALTLEATGLTGRVARARITLPIVTLTASGTVGAVGRAYLTLPALRMVPAAISVLTLPALTLHATGTMVVSAEYEAYSFALIPTDNGEGVAATRYTDYPFERIVRFRDTYYGMAADGLYELAGDDFDGTPIVAVVTFPAHDYGSPNVKRGRALHLAGRFGGDLQVSATVAEGSPARTYTFKPALRTGARNVRVPIGRGLAARYWSFSLTNTDGQDFTLEEATPEFDVSRRTVGA